MSSIDRLMSRFLAMTMVWAVFSVVGPVAAQEETQKDSTPARPESATENTTESRHAKPEEIDFVPNDRPALAIPRLDGIIEIDGELNDSGWERAARAINFTETNPGDRVKPPVETEAWVTYDDANLYIAFVAEDDPGAIRASLSDRDQMFNDDYVGILLDTYGDASWAYELFVNPLGIQGDLRWSGGNEDSRFDIVYHSRGRITETGYQVEMAIPFSSLRFPDRPEQTWRATFWRTHPRDTRRQYTWAATDRDEPCWPCQWGTLTGIRNVKPGSKLDLLPSVTASQSSSLMDGNDPFSDFHSGSVDPDASLNARYAFTNNLIGEVALNPDFSQVEADVAQVDVNTTFALFFPERRPFFQEGADLFNSPIDVIYTRSINDPSVAGRFTGRLNRTAFAVIGARDETSGALLPFEEQSEFVELGKTTTGVFRFKQTVLEDSFIGAVGTHREWDIGGSGSILGADGELRFLKNYRFGFQLLGSRTNEPDAPLVTQDISALSFGKDNYTAAFDGESYDGSAVHTRLSRNGRHWEFNLNYRQISPTFRADNGFVFKNDFRRANGWTGYFIRPDQGFFNLILPNVSAGRVWNFDGVRKDEWLRPELLVQFKGQTSASIGFVVSNEIFQGAELEDISRVFGFVNSNFSDPLRLGMFIESGNFVARNEDPPVLGNGTNIEMWGTIKPTQRLVFEPLLNFAKLDHPDGSEIFNGFIFRTRTQYQFTRELFLRLVVQYDDFNDAMQIDPLLSYKLNPFTVAFIGSSSNYRDLDGKPGFQETDRQIFAKLQYLFQI